MLHLIGDDNAAAEGDARNGTFDHIAFTCEDMPAFEQHLRNLNVPYRRVGPPGVPPRQLFLQDPAGNGVELNFMGAVR